MNLQNKTNVPDAWHRGKKAGKQWWMSFKQRNNLSIRFPEARSIGRVAAFNKQTVKKYFANLSSVLDEHNFTADRIFNADETGVTTAQNPKKIVTATGTKNVGANTSRERGELATVMHAI